MCLTSCLRLLSAIITDDVWSTSLSLSEELCGSDLTQSDGVNERVDLNNGEVGHGVSVSVGVGVARTYSRATVEVLVTLCNILDGKEVERSEIVKRLSSQAQVTLSLLLQTSQSARMFFMQIEEHSSGVTHTHPGSLPRRQVMS